MARDYRKLPKHGAGRLGISGVTIDWAVLDSLDVFLDVDISRNINGSKVDLNLQRHRVLMNFKPRSSHHLGTIQIYFK